MMADMSQIIGGVSELAMEQTPVWKMHSEPEPIIIPNPNPLPPEMPPGPELPPPSVDEPPSTTPLPPVREPSFPHTPMN